MNRDDIKKILLNFKSEVDDLHPLLHELFDRTEEIQNVEHTHGVNEKGADFILSKKNFMGKTDYIGVIVKNKKITQKGVDEIIRQIRECTKMERTVENGKRQVSMNQVWVFVNENISNNAKESITAEQILGVDFYDIEDIITLIKEYNYPIDGEVPSKISACLSKQFYESDKRSNQLIGYIGADSMSRISMDRKLFKIESDAYTGKKKRRYRSVPVVPEKAVNENNIVYIYGEPGRGKTDMLLGLLRHYASNEQYKKTKAIPVYISAKDIVDTYGSDPCAYIDKFERDNELLEDHSISDESSYIYIIDNVEECAPTEDERVEIIKEWIEKLYPKKTYKVVFASRELMSGKELRIARYGIAELSSREIVRVVLEQLKGLDVIDRIISDLTASPIFKSLSKSPIATVLLIKFLRATEHAYIPSALPDLYAKYVEISLGRWDTDVEEGVKQKKFISVTRILSNIAKYMVENNLHQINEDEAKSYFVDYLSKRNLEFNASDLFDEAIARSDLLVLDNGTFKFSHRTVQEFFYAQILTEDVIDEYGEEIFSPKMINSIYFYVGKEPDCPKLINKISAITPNYDGTMFNKLINMSNILLAGHITEYEHIRQAIKRIFIEVADYIESVFSGERQQSSLTRLSVMHCLLLIRIIADHEYSYLFFKEAIEGILIEIEDDKNISDNVKSTTLFLTNVVYGSLGGDDMFTSIINNKKIETPVHIKLAIDHETDHKEKISPLVKKYKRTIERSLRKNANLSYLYEKKIIDIPKLKNKK